MSVWNWIIAVALTLYFIVCVIWSIRLMYHTIKCFKVLKCSNRDCKFRKYCDSYKEVLTEEEAEELKELLKHLR